MNHSMIDFLGWTLTIVGGAVTIFGFVCAWSMVASLGWSLFAGGVMMTAFGWRMMAYADRGMQRDHIRLANSKNR